MAPNLCIEELVGINPGIVGRPLPISIRSIFTLDDLMTRKKPL
jgi:hypothetical protein